MSDQLPAQISDSLLYRPSDEAAGAMEPPVIESSSDLAALLFEKDGAIEPAPSTHIEPCVRLLDLRTSDSVNKAHGDSFTLSTTSFCLRRICSPTWSDFIDKYIECTRSLDPTLLPSDTPATTSQDTSRRSIFEQVIYSTSVALVAQWNMPHSAIQFHMTQAWNIFQYGLVVGRMSSNKAMLDTSVVEQQRIVRMETAAPAVRTLRSAERHLSVNHTDAIVVHAACSNVLCQNVSIGTATPMNSRSEADAEFAEVTQTVRTVWAWYPS